MQDWLNRFVEDGTIGESQLEEARNMAANLGIPVEDALVRLGYISAADLGQAQASRVWIRIHRTRRPPDSERRYRTGDGIDGSRKYRDSH